MPKRTLIHTDFSTLYRGDYRYGYNGMERDDEVKGQGNSVNYKYRMHDPRIGRFFAIDPLTAKYPHYTPYSFSGNRVIDAVELEGMEPVEAIYLYGFEFDKPKLTKASQWYVKVYISGLRGVGNSVSITDEKSYNKAAKYNTENGIASAYTSIGDRNDYYAWVAEQLKPINSVWFDAAKIVTAWNGVGAAEFPVNFDMVTDEGEHFLKSGNRYLLNGNIFNAKYLIQNGKLDRTFTDAKGNQISFRGLSGIDLDYALVVYEQTVVEKFIGKYKENHPNINVSKVIADINSAYRDYRTGFLGNADINSVISEHFTDKEGNTSFDFGNFDHRVKLGQELIKILANRKKSANATKE